MAGNTAQRHKGALATSSSRSGPKMVRKIKRTLADEGVQLPWTASRARADFIAGNRSAWG